MRQDSFGIVILIRQIEPGGLAGDQGDGAVLPLKGPADTQRFLQTVVDVQRFGIDGQSIGGEYRQVPPVGGEGQDLLFQREGGDLLGRRSFGTIRSNG